MKKRLVILNEFFYPDHFGGTGKVLSDLARRLADEHGWEIRAITTARSYRDNDRTLGETDEWDGIQISRLAVQKSRVADLGARMKSDLQMTWGAFRLLLRTPADAILVSTAPPVLPFAAWAAAKLRKTPYFYIIYDLEPDRAVALGVAKEGDRKERLLRAWQRRWMLGATKVVAIGRCMKDLIEREYHLPPGKIEVIVVGEDAAEVRPHPKQSGSGFTVLYSGNFGRYHDFEPILHAAELLQDDARFQFVLSGGGHKKDWIAEQIATRSIQNVDLRPFAPPEEYESLLASADVSLVTLEPGMEGLCVPSKFYSILASGRPTIALMERSCEVARTIEERRCGLVLPQADGRQLADALLKLAEDPDELDCMGFRARKALEEEHSSAKVADKFSTMMMGGGQ